MRTLSIFCIWLLTTGCFGQNYERIISFHSDMNVEESGDILVTETIEIYSTGNTFKRGLVRSLPIQKRQDSIGRIFRPDYEILSIKRDGKRSDYHLEKEGKYKSIYIGNENVYLDPGSYTYEIEYRTNDQIRFFEQYDELYWNVNGTKWALPMEKVTATVTLPSEAEMIQQSCYTGRYRSEEQDCFFEKVSENKFRFEANSQLNPNENLSIAIGFQKGIVPAPPPPTFFQRNGIMILGIIITFFLLAYYIFTWLQFGIDPQKPTVFPQFDPPQDLSPASVGMIKKGSYWNDLMTASIINLASKGYLTIEENTKKYVFGLFKNQSFTVRKQKEATAELPEEERLILNKLFKKSETAVTFEGEYDSTIAKAVRQYQQSMNKQWNPLLWKGFHAQFWIVPIITVVISVIVFGILAEHIIIGTHSARYFFLFIILNILLFVIYQWLIRKPDMEKLRLQSHISGFEMYLGAAEEKQLQHFNPPELTPEVFEKLLPYAIALDTEKVWGEKFQRLIDQSTIQQDYHPTWYSGGSFTNIGDFSHSLNSSFSNSLQHSSTSSSSGSGSGGGGFSGGGGGGGGGGGW